MSWFLSDTTVVAKHIFGRWKEKFLRNILSGNVFGKFEVTQA